MSLPLDMEQSASLSPEVHKIIDDNGRRVGATPEMVEFYRNQPLGILINTKGSRRNWNAVVGNMISHPDETTVWRITAEGGGNGKSLRAQKAVKVVNFDGEFIENFMAATGGWRPNVEYLARTTVGIDLQSETGPDGKPLVDVTAPNWRPPHIEKITTRFEDVVAIAGTNRFQEMNKEKFPGEKVTTLLVVEDLAAHSGRTPFQITRNHFGLWVVSNPVTQDMASEQRRRNDDPDAVLGEIYLNNGRISLDNPNFRGTDAEDYMGNDGSRRRAEKKMEEEYLMAEDVQEEVAKRGIRRNYHLYDIREDIELRNQTLRVFYEIRAFKELGFSKSHAAVVDNVVEEQESYNLQLMRGARVNTTELMRWMPK